MKMLIATAVMVFNVSAQAEPISSCMGKIEVAVKAAALVPSYKKIILENLDRYQTLAAVAKENAELGRSNDKVVADVEASLDKQRDSYLGSEIADCVSPYVTFKGTRAQQKDIASYAFKKIVAMKNSIGKSVR